MIKFVKATEFFESATFKDGSIYLIDGSTWLNRDEDKNLLFYDPSAGVRSLSSLIAAPGGPGAEAWNGLTKTDNSIGLGGEVVLTTTSITLGKSQGNYFEFLLSSDEDYNPTENFSSFAIYGQKTGSAYFYMEEDPASNAYVNLAAGPAKIEIQCDACIGDGYSLVMGSPDKFFSLSESQPGIIISGLDSALFYGVPPDVSDALINFGDDWIPYWGAIRDNLIPSPSEFLVQAWNGLNKIDNSIGLGGQLKYDASIWGDYGVYFGKFAATSYDISTFHVNAKNEVNIVSIGEKYSRAFLRGDGLLVLEVADNTESNKKRINLNINQYGISVGDPSSVGLFYDSDDYSPTGLSLPNSWIPHYGAVKNYVDGSLSTASNIGTGTGVFSSKIGNILRFKSIEASTGMTIADSPDASMVRIALTVPVRIADGTAAAPSYSFASNTNTGFFRQAANKIGVATNGTENFRFDVSVFHADGDIIAFSTTISDIRLKTNIEPISQALEIVQQLNGVTFEFKNKPNARHFGFIAQEVEKILPEIVVEHQLLRGGDEFYKTLHNTEIIPYLVEAIKEQQKIIDHQKQEISEIRGKLNLILEHIKI